MRTMDNVKKRIIISMGAILLLILTLFGITYAYFTAKIRDNSESKSIEVVAAYLELTYNDGNGVLESAEKLTPGNLVKFKTKEGEIVEEKIFTVKNTGTRLIEGYNVYLENVTNELENPQDLIYELTCVSDMGTCKGSTGSFPKPTTENPNTDLITNSIKVGETQAYTLTLTYKETYLNQSSDMNKTIEAKINIKDDNEYFGD